MTFESKINSIDEKNELSKKIDNNINKIEKNTKTVNVIKIEQQYSGLDTKNTQEICENCFNKNLTLGMQEKGLDFKNALNSIAGKKEKSV